MKVKFIFLGFILGVLTVILYQLWIPIDKDGQFKVIKIEKGMNLRSITKLLKDEGIVRSGPLFEILMRITAQEKKIKAGPYKLSPSQNLLQVLRVVREGRLHNLFVTIPEGYNIYQIANLLKNEGVILSEDRFIELTEDKDFILKLGLNLPKLEGCLFPETYSFEPESKEEKVIEIFINEFKKRVLTCQKYQEQSKSLGLTMQEVLTLASLIEKETSISEEGPLISAVFHNRLKKGMPLESDPTVIYALGKRFDGDLKREDLHLNSPYNTYLHKGLPPTPICNPGIKSIESALYPAPVDYLFFVAKGDGSHIFSSNPQEHRENVIKYQIEPKMISIRRGVQRP